MRSRNHKRVVVTLWVCILVVFTVYLASNNGNNVLFAEGSEDSHNSAKRDTAVDQAIPNTEPIRRPRKPSTLVRFNIETEIATQKAFEKKELAHMEYLATEGKKPFFRFYLACEWNGFASQLNNGLNGILMSRIMGNPFQFVVNTTWAFVSWDAHFDDFSAGINDPDYRLFAPEGSRNCTSEEPLTTMESFRDAKEEICTGHSMNPNWIEFRRLMDELVTKDNTLKDIFLTKRRYTHSVWHLKPQLQSFVDEVVDKVFNADLDDPPLLVGVHLRRGDKIDCTCEARDIPMRDFAAKVLSIPALREHNKTLLFTFSDDDAAIATFEQELHSMAAVDGFPSNSLQIITMDKLLTQFYPNYQILAHDGYRQVKFKDQAPEYRIAYTRDLVLTLSLNRYTDYFVGTFSSNIGRLAALLRYDAHLENNFSLDHEWYHN